jgi:short-subunit dehydrogenase
MSSPVADGREGREGRLARVAITGASSGIGAALAHRLAGPGRHLGLLGRDAARLAATAAACRAKGATTEIASLEATDRAAMQAFIQDFAKEHPLDLLIANAGMLDGRRSDQTVEDGAVARRVLETNLLATVDLVHAVLPDMRRRRQGAIVLVSSLAALVPLPDAPAYSASKAALLSYGIALRDAVAPEGIRVVVACPGYVATAMSRIHHGARPGEISADDAALRILDGLKRNRAFTGFPLVPFWLSRVNLLVPEFIRRRGMRASRFSVDQ